jgi:hypothetical protein
MRATASDSNHVAASFNHLYSRSPILVSLVIAIRLRIGEKSKRGFDLARAKDRQLVCQRIMALLLRWTGIALVSGLLVFYSSCEKHPLGEMPDVQREQVDPAKNARSRTTATDSDRPSPSATPAEFFPANTRP